MSDTVYTEADLKRLAPLIAQACAMRNEDVTNKVARDEGTCVLGAGIAIYYRAPRKRRHICHVIVDAPFQGNVGSYRACERALAFLRVDGVDAVWEDGRMD